MTLKSLAAGLVALGGMVGSVLASPDGVVVIRERLLGGNPDGYALLRTVDDNCCSYYQSQLKTYLDEYSSSDQKLVRSTLLVDKITRFPDRADPQASAEPVILDQTPKDPLPAFTEVLLKYPAATGIQQVKPEVFSQLRCDPYGGVWFHDLKLVAKEWFDERFKIREGDWKLVDVFTSEQQVYLTFSKGEDEGSMEFRVTGLSKDLSSQFRYHAALGSEVYSYGTFRSETEAQQAAAGLQERYPSMELQIWSSMVEEAPAFHLIQPARPFEPQTMTLDQLQFRSKVVPISTRSFMRFSEVRSGSN